MLSLMQKLKLSQNKLLSQEKLRELIAKAQEGDIESRNKIIEHNCGLIVRYAKLFKRAASNVEYDDLFQEGVIGMIAGIENFDLNKDFKFSTYVLWFIRQAIWRYLDNNGRIIRVPVRRCEQVRQIKKKLARNKKLTKKEEDLYAIYKDTTIMSLDKQRVDVPGDSFTFHSIIPSLIKESQDLVKHDLETLLSKVNGSKRNKTIFRRRASGEKLGDIGKDYKLTRERIRQINDELLQKIDKLIEGEK